MSLKSTKEIWDYLKTEYAGDEKIRGMQILNLVRDFELQKMKETDTIKEYSDRLVSTANKVRLLGSSLADSRIVQKILVTIPERFKATITTLENTKGMSKISLTELLSALQAQEQRCVMRQEGAIEGALPVKHQDDGKNRRPKNKKFHAANGENSAFGNKNKVWNRRPGVKKDYPPCQHCGKKGHPPFKCWRRPDAKCNKCNHMGHEAVICKYNNQKSVEAQVADQEEEDDQLFVATCFTSHETSESWLIDSGCTNHMTHDKELFKDLKSTESKKVKIGNGEHIAVKGKGTVAITSRSGTKFISDVLYVPGIDQNLLSVGQLVENGFKVKFMEKTCVIENATGQKMFEVEMKGRSFSLNPMQEEQSTFLAKESTIMMWHKRLGHYHHQGIVKMKSKSMALDLPEFDDRIMTCKACQFGKQNRKSFPKTTWRTTCKLQLIHTDISGPQRTPSLAGNRYYAAFIDDFTRMCWIFFLKFKSEIAGAFWKFKRMVENQSGNHIQILWSDNGKEYTSDNFNAFCEEAGIEHQLTAPYSPQQNGVSERRNKYILEMTRCMLHEKNLPKKLWAEATHTAVFLQNRLPTKAVNDQTPYEAWYGRKPFLYYERHKMDDCRFCYNNESHKLGDYNEGGVFTWSSKQEIVAQSTAEAKFIAAASSVNQALWLRKLLCDLNFEQEESTKIFVDNQAAIAISHNPVFHGKTKHFNIKLFFLREVQKEGDIVLVHCKAENQLADIFTKPLPVSKFEALRTTLGVCRS
ncbi:hypothetical protein GQ457_02G041430 [Hibiscus cannabinus]